MNSIRKIKEDDRYKAAKSVAVQLPEGMKRGIGEITKEFKDKELVFVAIPS